MFGMLGGLDFSELMVILLIVLLLFGSHRVTDLARNLGRAVNEFKKGMAEIQSSAPPPPPSPAEIAERPRDAATDARTSHDGGH